MNSKDFCTEVGKQSGVPRDVVQKVFFHIISYGKKIIAEGDYWRLPGLGKFWCANLKPTKYLDRFELAKGRQVYHDLPARRRIKFKFAPYASANHEVGLDPSKLHMGVEPLEDDDADPTS